MNITENNRNKIKKELVMNIIFLEGCSYSIPNSSVKTIIVKSYLAASESPHGAGSNQRPQGLEYGGEGRLDVRPA